jgi:membrane-associated protein
VLIVLLCVAAVAGDNTSYWIGRKAGQALYSRPNSRWFRQDHLVKTRAFYEKYGGITLVMARFIPFARTFAPVVAGIAGMKYTKFIAFSIAGGIGWIMSMTLLGYYLAISFPGIQKYVEYVIAAVIALSLLPLVIKYLQSRSRRGSADPANASHKAAVRPEGTRK